MPLRVTARPKLGPLRFNTGRNGLTSVALKVGPLTWRLWSRTGVRGLSSLDMPGPFSYRPSARRLNAAQRAVAARRRAFRRALLTDLLAAGLIAALVFGTSGPVLAIMAGLVLLAGLRWWLARRTLAGTP